MARSLPIDTGGFLVAPLTISYDRAVLNALLDDPDYDYADQFLALDPHDRGRRPRLPHISANAAALDKGAN